MGFDLDNLDQMTGAIYMGAGTSWEVIWTVISIIIGVAACIVGSRHELDAYKKIQK